MAELHELRLEPLIVNVGLLVDFLGRQVLQRELRQLITSLSRLLLLLRQLALRVAIVGVARVVVALVPLLLARASRSSVITARNCKQAQLGSGGAHQRQDLLPHSLSQH